MENLFDANHCADDLIWKIAYFAFEVEKDFRREFVKLSEDDRFSAFERGLLRSLAYALERTTDEKLPPISEKFFENFTTLVAQVGATEQVAPNEYVFRDGGAPVAADLATCLLRHEGFRLYPDTTTAQFRRSLINIFKTQRDVLSLQQAIKALVQKTWRFEYDPDLNAFRPIREFRDLQGGRLDVLLLSC